MKSGTVARSYVGIATSAAAAGVKRSRDKAFIDADALPLPEQVTSSYAAFPRNNRIRVGPLEVKVEVWEQ